MKDGIARSLARGTLASIAGLVAMDLYFRAMKSLKERREQGEEGRGSGRGRVSSASRGEEHALDDISLVGQQSKEGEPATVAVGRIAYEKVTGREPDREQGARLGKAVHWGYGLAVGSLYGLLEPRFDRDLSAGLGYGVALWLLGDELAVPALGLAKGPTAHPPTVHAQALGAHLVYGLATSAATKVLHRVM